MIWTLANVAILAMFQRESWGPTKFCPTSVLSLLGVIVATLGYDLAVVEEGL